MSATLMIATSKLDKLSVAKPQASRPSVKPASRKRKLEDISQDGQALDAAKKATGEPAAKKARKFTPGFKRRDAPPLRGQTMIPIACASLITGQLPSLTRDECGDLVKQYGGRVTGSVSGMTRYLIAGEEPGESKLKKARDKKVSKLRCWPRYPPARSRR